jgi:hypothetical protein
MPRYDLMHWSQRVRDQQAARAQAPATPYPSEPSVRPPAKPRATRPKPPKDEDAELLSVSQRALVRGAGVGRRTALTRLCEAGQPDWVIQAQMGHVSPAMMKTYSHIRRKALDTAATALQPTFKLKFPKFKGVRSTKKERQKAVVSQFVSQSAVSATKTRKKSCGIGSPHWTISATGCGWAQRSAKGHENRRVC